jgi:hypothetical protein
MTVRFVQWTLDVRNVELMAEFWSAALGFSDIRRGDDGSAKLYPPADAPPDVPTVWLQNTGEPKQGKNRDHPDRRRRRPRGRAADQPRRPPRRRRTDRQRTIRRTRGPREQRILRFASGTTPELTVGGVEDGDGWSYAIFQRREKKPVS